MINRYPRGVSIILSRQVSAHTTTNDFGYRSAAHYLPPASRTCLPALEQPTVRFPVGRVLLYGTAVRLACKDSSGTQHCCCLMTAEALVLVYNICTICSCEMDHASFVIVSSPRLRRPSIGSKAGSGPDWYGRCCYFAIALPIYTERDRVRRYRYLSHNAKLARFVVLYECSCNIELPPLFGGQVPSPPSTRVREDCGLQASELACRSNGARSRYQVEQSLVVGIVRLYMTPRLDVDLSVGCSTAILTATTSSRVATQGFVNAKLLRKLMSTLCGQVSSISPTNTH